MLRVSLINYMKWGSWLIIKKVEVWKNKWKMKMKIKTNQWQLYDKYICCLQVFAQQNDITLREFISFAIHQCFSLMTLKEGWKNRWRIKNEIKIANSMINFIFVRILFSLIFEQISNALRMIQEIKRSIKSKKFIVSIRHEQMNFLDLL